MTPMDPIRIPFCLLPQSSTIHCMDIVVTGEEMKVAHGQKSKKSE